MDSRTLAKFYRKTGFCFTLLVDHFVIGSYFRQTWAEDAGLDIEFLSYHQHHYAGEALLNAGR